MQHVKAYRGCDDSASADKGARRKLLLRLTGFDWRPHPKLTTLGDDMLGDSDVDEDED
jgi:hypothetical protein